MELALEAAQMAVWDSEMQGGCVANGEVFWSARGATLLGLEASPITHAFDDFLSRVYPDDRERVHDVMQKALDTRSNYDLQYRVVWPDLSLHWLSSKAHVLRNNHRAGQMRILGIVWDVTKHKQTELEIAEQKELAEVTLNSIGDGVITTDAAGNIRYFNRIAEQLTDWSNDQVKNVPIQNIFILTDEVTGELLENVATKCLRLKKGIGISSRAQLITRDGRKIPIEDSAAPIRAEDGEILGTVIVFRDVSHERQLKHELSWQGKHDPLTGLLNRHEFEIHVAAALASAKDENNTHALLYIDLDQFKIINDTCGHSTGDMLLQQLAKTLQSHMRDNDILARLGGDEFGMLLLNCPILQARLLAEKFRQFIKDFHCVCDSLSLDIGASIGLVPITEDSKSVSELLIAADHACYIAKERGRNRVYFYQESDATLVKRHDEILWVSRLNEAFEKNLFKLFIQPIAGICTDCLKEKHVEVLLRLIGDDGELILPTDFIPAAERYDLMISIDRWVIEAVCRHIHTQRRSETYSKKWDVQLSYSINLSGVSLNDDSLHEFISKQFQRYEIQPETIRFEITETAAISNLTQAQTFIANIKNLGCQFSLDDFGSGFSSFAYLKTLQVDYLKIDGIFVRDIATNPINHAMVTAINQVGHVMGIKTIAEFAETDAALETLRNIGLDYAQGYAIGTPQPLTFND